MKAKLKIEEACVYLFDVSCLNLRTSFVKEAQICVCLALGACMLFVKFIELERISLHSYFQDLVD